MADRKGPRVNLEIDIRLISSAKDHMISAWVLDLSEGGLKLQAKFPIDLNAFRPGDDIYFKTGEDFYSIRGRGTVTWVSEDRETIGIKFTDFDQESRKSLIDFLKMVLPSETV